jgi:hypothetical protein
MRNDRGRRCGVCTERIEFLEGKHPHTRRFAAAAARDCEDAAGRLRLPHVQHPALLTLLREADPRIVAPPDPPAFLGG